MVTKSRKPLIFLSVFDFFEKVGSFFLKNLFFILANLRPVSLGTMCLASRLLENHKWAGLPAGGLAGLGWLGG